MALRIRFSKSNSVAFDMALTLARAHKSFTETPSGKWMIYSVEYDEYRERTLFGELARLCAGWKTALFYQDDKLLTWDEVFDITYKRPKDNKVVDVDIVPNHEVPPCLKSPSKK